MDRRGRGERGLTSIEYALMAAIVVLLLVSGIVVLVDAVQARFDRNASCATTAYQGRGC
jgi:Flp pilus assembly pilin Flp